MNQPYRVQRILVPIDGSEFSRYAAEVAVRLAQTYGSELLFLHVVDNQVVEALAHREVLKPLLAHLAARHRLSIDAVASPVTLRAKMLVAFLGLTVFACGLSFFWSFVEYKRLAGAP